MLDGVEVAYRCASSVSIASPAVMRSWAVIRRLWVGLAVVYILAALGTIRVGLRFPGACLADGRVKA